MVHQIKSEKDNQRLIQNYLHRPIRTYFKWVIKMVLSGQLNEVVVKMVSIQDLK